MDGSTPSQDDNAPMTLQEACRLVFRDKIKPATLRAEAARGRLVIERIGRKDFVTMAALNEMRVQCRIHPKEREFSSIKPQSSGSSVTDRSSAALAAALQSAHALKKSSRRIAAQRNAASKP